MKHLFTFLATLLFTVSFAQQKLIAIKGTTTDAIATTLEEAINITQPNDKIYLPGGNYTLNDSLQKPLHIIGTGYNHLIPRATPITVFTSELKIGSQASGAVIEGVKLADAFYCSSDNITFKKVFSENTIGSAYPFHDYVLKNNIKNLRITNSIINHRLELFNGVYEIANFAFENSIIALIVTISHSSFKNCYVKSIAYSYYSLIINSIYDGYGFDNSNITNSFVLTNNGQFAMYDNNIGNLNNDYHLSPTAPIQNIGIYYGDYPWKDGGQPINPHILENNSFLDVQNEQFKLKVKVVPQTN